MFPILSETLFPSLSTSVRKIKILNELKFVILKLIYSKKTTKFEKKYLVFFDFKDKFICSQNVWTLLYHVEHMKLNSKVFLLYQLRIVNYYVKSLSNNLSNQNIKMCFQKNDISKIVHFGILIQILS